MNAISLRRAAMAALLGLAAWAALGAIEKGATVYAKRNDTPLLSEPRPLAAPAGKAAFAEGLVIEDVSGNWLRVKAKRVSGWIFAGNVAEEKPKQAPGAGLTTLAASETDTAAAARPLTPAGDGYAVRHDAAEAKADVEWLDRQAGVVKPAAVEAYLRDNKKGEYAP
jgi:hypothetical protein